MCKTSFCGVVAERLRRRSCEQRVPSSSPAWTLGLYVFNVVCAARLAICRIALVN